MKYTVLKNKQALEVLESIKRRMQEQKATTEYLLKMHRHKILIPGSKVLE